MAQVFAAFSYDTEQAVPEFLPHYVIAEIDYTLLGLPDRQKLWADYLRERIWGDPGLAKRSIVELQTIQALGELFGEFEGKFTSFVLGKWLDFIVKNTSQEYVRRMFSSNAIDIQSHSYHHRTYKQTDNVLREQMSPRLAASKISVEIWRANEAIRNHLGITPIGIRTPMGNISPLGAEDWHILTALRGNDIRFVSSWLKKAQCEPNSPQHVQPSFYRELGFGEILEIPAVGFFDVHFTQPTRLLVFNEEETPSREAMRDYYIGLLDQAMIAGQREKRDIFVPLVFHPWAVGQYDPDLRLHREILTFCKRNGIPLISHSDIYQRRSS